MIGDIVFINKSDNLVKFYITNEDNKKYMSIEVPADTTLNYNLAKGRCEVLKAAVHANLTVYYTIYTNTDPYAQVDKNYLTGFDIKAYTSYRFTIASDGSIRCETFQFNP